MQLGSRLSLLVLTALSLGAACASPAPPPDPASYRLANSGNHWDVVRGDRVVEDLLPRYAEFFEVILDPSVAKEPDLRPLRDDLERSPADRRNFDALNALAIGYFELNFRAASDRGGNLYLANSFGSAKLLAVPWRAYSEVSEAALRDAILDFFEDAGLGDKLGSADTGGRVARIVESLAKKEDEPQRKARILSLAERIMQRAEERIDHAR